MNRHKFFANPAVERVEWDRNPKFASVKGTRNRPESVISQNLSSTYIHTLMVEPL